MLAVTSLNFSARNDTSRFEHLNKVSNDVILTVKCELSSYEQPSFVG